MRLQAVHTWYKNNKPFKNQVVFWLEQKILLWRVVAKLKADEIHKLLMEKDPDVEKGGKEYPGLFQKGLTEYMGRMRKSELAEMEEVRMEWQDARPPREIQLKWANHLPPLVEAEFWMDE